MEYSRVFKSLSIERNGKTSLQNADIQKLTDFRFSTHRIIISKLTVLSISESLASERRDLAETLLSAGFTFPIPSRYTIRRRRSPCRP